MPNIWTEFAKLIDKDQTYVATISNTDGTNSTVELLSGDMLKVRGTGTVGNRVYVRGGEIVQAAGALTQYDMILY